MSLDKPIHLLSEADLQELISNGVSERRTIDYKQALPGANDEAKKEFLADVSSFANAAGGSLVYGVKEEGGLATELAGVQVANPDQEKQRLENMIRDGIAPRVAGIELSEPIALSSGGAAVVIRIPRSWISPHMVTFKGHSKFYSRNSAGKYPLNVDELRNAFAFAEATKDRIRDFRAERISKISAQMTPVKLISNALVVLHVMPLSAFESDRRFDAGELGRVIRAGMVQPIYAEQAFSSRYNFEGCVIHDAPFELGQGGSSSYLQFFRTGVLESVSAELLYGGKLIPSAAFEGRLLQRDIPAYVNMLKKLGASPPIFFGLSLLGVSGYSMQIPPALSFSGLVPTGTFDREMLILPEAMAQGFDDKAALVMKPAFDSVWNAVGREGSIYYQNGEWLGPNKFLPGQRSNA